MPRSARATIQRTAFDVTPVSVYLVRSHFTDYTLPDERVRPWGEEIELDQAISVFRHSLRKLTVALTVSTIEDSPVDVSVMYASDYVMGDAVPESEIDEFWLDIAFDLAPSLLYPFAREELVRLTNASRARTLVLPFLPLPVDRPDDFEVPAPPQVRRVQRELPLESSRRESRRPTAKPRTKEPEGGKATRRSRSRAGEASPRSKQS